MRTTVSVICYKSKTLADGTHPLMLRITRDGKRVFKSIGISVLPQDWDFKKEQPKPRCAHCDLIRKKILQIEMQYQTLVMEKECENEEYTAQSILTSMEEKPIKAQTVEDFYKNLISELRENGQVGIMIRFEKYKNHANLFFHYIANLLICQSLLYKSEKAHVANVTQ